MSTTYQPHQPRQPKGIPAGGQFAPTSRGEASQSQLELHTQKEGTTTNPYIHEAHGPEDVAEDAVNCIRVSDRVAATGEEVHLLLIWLARDELCCPGQPGWPATRIPRVWDPSGLGHFQVATGIQCGGCGNYVHPPSRLLASNASQEEMQAAAGEILAQAAEQDQWARNQIRRHLREELVWVRETETPLDDLPRLADMATPGVGVDDDGSLVAWDYDPRDPSLIIEVRER